jgi:hypothetical protein
MSTWTVYCARFGRCRRRWPFGGLLGDDGDLTAAQVNAVSARCVGPRRPAPGPGGSGACRRRAGHCDGLQDGGELRAVAPLPGGDHDWQGLLALLDRQVVLCGQAAAGPPEGLISWLVPGRLGLQVPLFRVPAACWCAWTAAGSMDTSQVTCPAMSARVAGRRGPSPRSRRAASAGTARRRSPSAVGRRDVPPRRPGPDPPPDPVYELPSRPLRWPPWLLSARQQRLQHRPLRIGQVEPPRHRYPGHEVSCRWSSWSLTHGPETSPVPRCDTRTRLRSHQTVTFKTRPSGSCMAQP